MLLSLLPTFIESRSVELVELYLHDNYVTHDMEHRSHWC